MPQTNMTQIYRNLKSIEVADRNTRHLDCVVCANSKMLTSYRKTNRTYIFAWKTFALQRHKNAVVSWSKNFTSHFHQEVPQ